MHGFDFSLPITNPVMIFALVLLIILVLPLLFERIRIPGMVGLILAGVVIGPHALGLLERDQTMELLGTVGLLYIMFIAGLEVDLNEFNRQRQRSVIFGSLTFILPQGLGTLMAHYLLGFPWVGAVLLGAVFASHTLLAYPIVSRFGLSKGPAVTTAVGATILTDTAALLVLAVIVRLHEGALGATFWIQMIGLLTLFVVLVLWGVPRMGQWFFRRIRANGVAEFVFVLAVVFVAAVMAEAIGVEPIVGAFLAGLALNRLVPEHSTLMNRTQFVGNALFIPFFLISVGMLVDLRILVSGIEAWIVAGAMLGTLVVTKWMAAYSTQPLFGYSREQAWMMFGLTVPQAAATLATVLIGYRVGIFGDNVLNGTILMILVTCMIGPWIAEKYGRLVALQMEQIPYQPGSGPQRILVPLANPATAPDLMDLALMLRSSTSEEPIFPLAVAQNVIEQEAAVAESEKLLSHAVMHGVATGVPVIPVVRVDRNVSHGILRAVREQRISTIVIGWNGEGAARHLVFGSILDQLLTESRELVLVSRIAQPLNTIGRLVLLVPPYAEREPGMNAVLREAKILAGQLSARILVIGTGSSVEATSRRLAATKPDVPVETHELAEWSAVVSQLDIELSPTDMLWLASTRQGSLSWRPALLRLPRILARRYPDNSLVVSYGPVSVNEATGAYALSAAAPTIIQPEHIHLGIAAETHRDVLLAMLGEDENQVLRLLEKSAGVEGVPEIAPGVVLFHAHDEAVPETRLYVAISPDGFRTPGASGPAHVLVAALSPGSDPPERHLQLLALVARMFRSPEAVDALRESGAADDARAVLVDAAKSELPFDAQST